LKIKNIGKGINKMKIAIIGRTSMLLNTAKLLLNNGYEIAAVITSPSAPEYSVSEDDYKHFAKSQGAYFSCTTKINQLVDDLKKLDLTIGVSLNYSSTISSEVIDCFKMGILNAHLGDLPKYRGNATPNWAILNGEKNIPLCIQYMIGGELDSGDVVAKEYIDININTKIREIYQWVEDITPNLYLTTLINLSERSDFILYKQSKDKSDIIRCYPRIPEDSKIDWYKNNIDILRLINASSKPFSGAYSFYDDKKIIIEDAELYEDQELYYAIPGQVSEINKKDGFVIVITGKGKLKLNNIIFENKEIKPTEVVDSIRKRFT